MAELGAEIAHGGEVVVVEVEVQVMMAEIEMKVVEKVEVGWTLVVETVEEDWRQGRNQDLGSAWAGRNRQ